ncbi:hypothetical protein TthAA22_24910 (plasmid) [Thermus thermophilus]|uniref:Immunogenic protein n=4 Tax=Thermus TaxID=270 RepID=A0A430RIQ9_THESC|nr:TAXI family TRAP transporter solute-binding subunit [Thermus scotoductus]RTH14302.1 immunogenic protein [Thermus scotoductus]BCZ90686.1 hypothetical protein TthAA22_24910 [Thermus thermophilus]
MGARWILLGVALLGVAWGQRVPLRIATANPGTYGYATASMLAEVLNQELPSRYAVVVQPFPSTSAAMRAVMNGEAELGYTAEVGMEELYQGVGPYQGYRPQVGYLVHTFYLYPMETFFVTLKANANRYRSLADLSGRPVFFFTAGNMNWLNAQRIFKALEYRFNHVEIDTGAIADALRAGTIVASVAYTISRASLVPAIREAEIRADLQVINPTPEEVRKLQGAGLEVVRISPRAFTKDVGVREILAVPLIFGYNARADLPEDLVYQILKAFEKAAPRLAERDAGFRPLAENFAALQVAAIRATPSIPVHPGLARYLREKGVWQAEWKVAQGR